jgi:hypothetical protein
MSVRSSRPADPRSPLLAAFGINLDTTIVNVALRTLVRELHASTTQLEWIVDAYNRLRRPRARLLIDPRRTRMRGDRGGRPSRAPSLPLG